MVDFWRIPFACGVFRSLRGGQKASINQLKRPADL